MLGMKSILMLFGNFMQILSEPITQNTERYLAGAFASAKKNLDCQKDTAAIMST